MGSRANSWGQKRLTKGAKNRRYEREREREKEEEQVHRARSMGIDR